MPKKYKHTPVILTKTEMLTLSKSKVSKLCILYGIDENSDIETLFKAQKDYLKRTKTTPFGVSAIVEEQTEMAKVTAEFSKTINLGNYNSAKVGGMVTVPVGSSTEQINAAIETRKLALKVLQEEVNKEVKKL